MAYTLGGVIPGVGNECLHPFTAKWGALPTLSVKEFRHRSVCIECSTYEKYETDATLLFYQKGLSTGVGEWSGWKKSREGPQRLAVLCPIIWV